MLLIFIYHCACWNASGGAASLGCTVGFRTFVDGRYVSAEDVVVYRAIYAHDPLNALTLEQ